MSSLAFNVACIVKMYNSGKDDSNLAGSLILKMHFTILLLQISELCLRKILYTINVDCEYYHRLVHEHAEKACDEHTNLKMCILQFIVLQSQVLNLRHEPIDLWLRLLHLCRYSMDFISTLISLHVCHATPQPLIVLFKRSPILPLFAVIPPLLEKQTDYHRLRALQLRVEINEHELLQFALKGSRVRNLHHLRSRRLWDLCAHLLQYLRHLSTGQLQTRRVRRVLRVHEGLTRCSATLASHEESLHEDTTAV